MIRWWAVIELLGIVAAILLASRRPSLRVVFRWLPVPLWCYLLPLGAKALGMLPADPFTYRALTTQLLPFALGLLLLGVDLPAIVKTGGGALIATMIGALSIMVGTVLGVWLFRSLLPPDAWKGAGALASTWTGGTMNLLAVRVILEVPDPLFAPLIVVDAVVAYSWMALLVAASAFQAPLNRWLRASPAAADHGPDTIPGAFRPSPGTRRETGGRGRAGSREADGRPAWARGAHMAGCVVLASALAIAARAVAARLPVTPWVSSATGWTVLLVTSIALALSLIPPIRRAGAVAGILGYPCLYLVLGATGAQADLAALTSAPVWLLLGGCVALLHGATLLLVGRQLRVPIGTLATASQANIGGLVSAPLVGAVYHQTLMPVGLLLAVGCNAVGTYLGLGAAAVAKLLLGEP